MSLAYGIIAVISLIMVGVCVTVDKKRDEWLIWLFSSVALCNLGYFMVSVSKELDAALNSNRIAYLGSVFLPFFLFMMVLRFCKIKASKPLMLTLVTIGIVMLGITTSPGISTVYYKTVDIEFVGGYTKLVRTYGPLHTLYYVYLGIYMLNMAGIAVYAVVKKKIKSHLHTFLLLSAVLCNIIIWLVEQFLPRGFEWLSVSYILTECLILALYQSMQKRGLMGDKVKPSPYTIDVLLVIFLLLFANFVRIITKGTTPAMYIVSHVVVISIYIGILISWGISVYERITHKSIRRYLMILMVLMVFWMLMRTLRHTVFYLVFPIGQWCWYAYYISMILIPEICFFASKYIGRSEEYRMPRKWHLMSIPSVILIIGILTNDLHQWAFKYYLGYEEGWNTYQYGFLYYVTIIWVFLCLIMMNVEAVKRCRVPGTNKFIARPLAMIGVGLLYTILYTIDTALFGFIEMTAALCFIVVAIWESCIKTGLIQSNTHYDELIRFSGLGVTVVDNSYATYYRSEKTVPLTSEQMKKTKEAPVKVHGGIRVSSFKIRGGYTLWQEDLSELLGVVDELAALREELKDSNAVSMRNYQLDKQIRALIEKNRLYDELYKQTATQINFLNALLHKLVDTEDADEKRELLRRIVVVGAYLKRCNNLILVNEQFGVIKVKELELSLNEMMKNLRLAGIACACSIDLEEDIPSNVAMQFFDFYEYIVENAFDGLESLLARFFIRDNEFYVCVDVVCNLDLTTLEDENITISISEENCYTLSFKAKEGDVK